MLLRTKLCQLKLLSRTILRNYSDAAPLHKIHEPLKDVEALFQRYRLNELRNPDQIRELVKLGSISEHIGNKLIHDLKVQTEAGSLEYHDHFFYSRIF